MPFNPTLTPAHGVRVFFCSFIHMDENREIIIRAAINAVIANNYAVLGKHGVEIITIGIVLVVNLQDDLGMFQNLFFCLFPCQCLCGHTFILSVSLGRLHAPFSACVVPVCAASLVVQLPGISPIHPTPKGERPAGIHSETSAECTCVQ